MDWILETLESLINQMIDVMEYSRLEEYEKKLAKLDKYERILKRMRREILSSAYIQWSMKDK